MFIVYIDVFSELDFNDLQFRISKNGVFAACIHLQGVTGVNIVNHEKKKIINTGYESKKEICRKENYSDEKNSERSPEFLCLLKCERRTLRPS